MLIGKSLPAGIPWERFCRSNGREAGVARSPVGAGGATDLRKEIPDAVRNYDSCSCERLALLAATQLPAKAGPVFDLKGTTGMVQLVKSGGGGGGGAFGGGSFSGGGGHMAAVAAGAATWSAAPVALAAVSPASAALAISAT